MRLRVLEPKRLQWVVLRPPPGVRMLRLLNSRGRCANDDRDPVRAVALRCVADPILEVVRLQRKLCKPGIPAVIVIEPRNDRRVLDANDAPDVGVEGQTIEPARLPARSLLLQSIGGGGQSPSEWRDERHRCDWKRLHDMHSLRAILLRGNHRRWTLARPKIVEIEPVVG